MQTQWSPILLLGMLAGVLGLVAIVISFRMQHAKRSRVALAIAVLPSLLMVSLFYSLAVHMYQSLGAWPESIGELGFPVPLVAHVHIAVNYCVIFFLVCIFAWPVGFVLCLLIRRWRVWLYYLGVYALACFVCLGAMMLAPSQFLDWWWD